MAWLSSGATNDELALALRDHDVIKSDMVLAAFQAVDRGLFVPRTMVERAYNDYPIRVGSMHLSAPHIYAQVLEAFDLFHGLSFLNLGSGSGYFSCLVGSVIGKDAINHGLEIDPTVIAACQQSCATYVAQRSPPSMASHDAIMQADNDDNNREETGAPEESSDDYSVPHVVQGSIYTMECAANVKYDRIYVGAGAPESLIATIHALLKPMGIAIGPFGDKLLKIRSREDGSCTKMVLTGVHFAPLRDDNNTSAKVCYFPPQVWTLQLHATYPRAFREAVAALYPAQDRLPAMVWLRLFEMLPQTWFAPERSATEKLRFLLELETSAREEAETRAVKAEAERDQYRLVMWRQQNQIQALLAQVQAQASRPSTDDEDDAMVSADHVE
ncbi:hypothetical protein SDRG_09861 [Saprolegnia diclina VS20]|uniref:Protein-L-isoaspartate O-methyltransferase n=1 Tax=Saprolegnia diclina (strain VS20) TaxID=1156394 RepID=T0RJX6_SAPDV|nr:hypothetical protein SDRG_09861 [Saprolegnia diclina VS20]EQC32538.1 hypothetical protein SDRG_09861 [Saprolegnia diclina VS20]|eukprot:XP_008614039.1 hypothetical protein SDRG_09861 [Saprolegnia diclina VS20]